MDYSFTCVYISHDELFSLIAMNNVTLFKGDTVTKTRKKKKKKKISEQSTRY